jgi:DnaK suppressor protein
MRQKKKKMKSRKLTKRKKEKKRRLTPQERTYQKKLLSMQEDLLRVVQAKERDLPTQETGDEADIASLSLEREILFEQSDNERLILDNIEAALHRLDQGFFGRCEACGKKIINARLKVMPYARYCIICQTKNESSRYSN